MDDDADEDAIDAAQDRPVGSDNVGQSSVRR
jgi:hypothetical protein